MEKKQTAIDSLIKRCNDSLEKEPNNCTEQEIGYSKALRHIIILLEEAKIIEKGQIMDAYCEGVNDFDNVEEGGNIDWIGYYNKTYGTC
jgi:hypothetical protein